MHITIEVTPERIADLMITAIESGDPVTTAARGGWCDGIYWMSRDSDPPESNKDGAWYAQRRTWANAFVIEVIEIDDETTGHETSHKVGPDDFVRGLTIMATKYPHMFKYIVQDNVDAPTADIFLQCVLFGEEKYA